MPVSPAISVRFYGGEDNDGLLAMLRSAFGRWPRVDVEVSALEHLQWKLSSPGAQGTHMVAEVDGTIIGSRLSVVRGMKVGDRELRYRFGTDTAVRADWQGRGVMAAMRPFGREELAARFDLVGGSTNNASILKLDVRDGRRFFANRIEVLECVRVARDSDAGSAGITLRSVESFDSRVEVLWREASNAFELAAVRTAESLNWRFADRKAGAFTIALAEEGDRVLGYVVFSGSGQKGQIADLFAVPDRHDVVASLVGYALVQLTERGVGKAQVWCPAVHPYRDTLLRCGFAKKRALHGVTLGTYRSDIDLSFMDDPQAAIHYSAGDTDLA